MDDWSITAVKITQYSDQNSQFHSCFISVCLIKEVCGYHEFFFFGGEEPE